MGPVFACIVIAIAIAMAVVMVVAFYHNREGGSPENTSTTVQAPAMTTYYGPTMTTAKT